MPMISVKAKKGRVVRESRYGAIIPDDRFVSVESTHYIRRMLNHWKDLELEPVAKKAPLPAKVEPLGETS
jgi:hypothetical protein